MRNKLKEDERKEKKTNLNVEPSKLDSKMLVETTLYAFIFVEKNRFLDSLYVYIVLYMLIALFLLWY